MSYRRRAGGGKRDAAEEAICQALEAVGATIYKLSGTGNPDVLISFRGAWQPLEIKSGKAGRLTRNQQDLRWPVVHDVFEALRAIGVET